MKKRTLVLLLMFSILINSILPMNVLASSLEDENNNVFYEEILDENNINRNSNLEETIVKESKIESKDLDEITSKDLEKDIKNTTEDLDKDIAVEGSVVEDKDVEDTEETIIEKEEIEEKSEILKALDEQVNSRFFNYMNSFSQMNRDISSQAISNIIVDKNSVSSGEDIKIIVNYNDKNGKINPGDYIKIDLGNNESVTVNGYREKKGLFFKGILVGHFEVAGSEAKIIFNNQVEAFLQGSVSGFIDFSAKIRNESHSNQTTSIISGGQYININIEKESSGGTSSQFFYKTGDIQTDNLEEVRWFLIFNSVGDEYSGYIDIDDQIQNPENHKIIKESVAITRVDHIGNSKSYYGTEGLTEFNNETGSTLVFTEDSVYGEIPWDRIAHSQISINYNTKILNPRAESFSNKVILNNSQQIIQEENFSVKNVSANAGIIGSKKMN